MAYEDQEAPILRDPTYTSPPPLPITSEARTERAQKQFLRSWSSRNLRRFISVFVIIVSSGVWQLLTTFQIVPSLALPSPLSVLHDLQALLTTGFAGKTLFEDTWASTTLISIGFVAAVFIGIPIGIFMGWSNIIFQIIDPYLQFIRPVPPLSYIPLLIL